MDKGQMKKGLLELCILQIVSSEDMYGYEIMKRVTEVFPDINESVVYVVLRRLHSDGCTESYAGETSGGPVRKYYRITDKGTERLCDMTAEWQKMLNAMKKLGL